MKAKIKLLAIGNEENYNYYILQKKLGLLDILSKALDSIGLEFSNFNLSDDENNPAKKRTIKNIKVTHESYGNLIDKKLRADIFYGEKKVFMALHCSKKLREKFNGKLESETIMPKFKDNKLKKKIK